MTRTCEPGHSASRGCYQHKIDRQAASPVIILGAARSGTKLLRSIVAASGAYNPIAFDVNYIWRYGSENLPHDVLKPEMVTPVIRKFIRNRLSRCARLQPEQFGFVEKTVSNVLRVPFVLEVFPNAKFIFLIRDGRDVIESAHRCWQEPPKLGYLLAKVRTFPWFSCAQYGKKYVRSVVERSLGISSNVRTWGPRYEGIDDDLHQRDLLEVCALQWCRSIEHYEAARHLIPAAQLLEMKYEDVVSRPDLCANRLANFLDLKDADRMNQFVARTVRQNRVGSHLQLSEEYIHVINEIAQPVLLRWKYSREFPLRTAA